MKEDGGEGNDREESGHHYGEGGDERDEESEEVRRMGRRGAYEARPSRRSTWFLLPLAHSIQTNRT